MKFSNSFKTAVNGLRTNKTRSALTILGIVIGIASVIILMSVGQGAQEQILGQFRALGAKTIVIEAGRMPEKGMGMEKMWTESLKESDLRALENSSNVPGLDKISPLTFGNAVFTYHDKARSATFVGTTDIWSDITDIHPEKGRFFNDWEIKNRAPVVVLGSKLKEDLFGSSEAVGKTVRIKNLNCKVIGVISEKGQFMMVDIDDIAALPYTTSQKYISGMNFFPALLATAKSEKEVPVVARDITLTLREQHGIINPDDDDFLVSTQADIVERTKVVTGILTIILISVASISLIVGGIGIMNIMLTSVTERTREIGLRKAVGARKKDILWQFLLEAVILTLMGGVIGIIIGGAGSFIGAKILGGIMPQGWAFTIPIWSIFLAFGVATVIGLIFGIYPARKAAEMSPIEALRYE
jgi:putative ABC transport system permease protein